MTAWQIYWVMQLDSISSLLFWVGTVSLVAGAATAAVSTIAAAEGEDWAPPVRSGALRVVAVGLAFVTINAFTPSTKTAAAMVVIPAIVNNETLRAEAGDMYQLAKQALREAVGAKKAEVAEAAK